MKTGLVNAINKLTYAFIFSISVNLYAQIPINGFCSYSVFNIPAGFSSVLTYNSNNDAYTDLLLYSPLARSSQLLEADEKGGFKQSRIINLRRASSLIKNISFNELYSKYFISLSRKERKAELLKEKSDGTFLILDTKTFTSYPQNCDIEDIDSDGSPEMLISGSAFDGLSVMSINKGKLTDKNVLSRKAFKSADFCDLNNDSYPDIAAINIMDISLDFYYNNSRGKFNFTRSLKLENLPFYFDAADLDFDSYSDLIWSDKRKIHILYGDALSSYKTEKIIYTQYDPSCIVVGDFNRDGTKDIVYADTSLGIVSVIFSKEGRSFSDELILFKKNNIKDLVPYYSKFISGIAVPGNDGKLYMITPYSRVGDEVNIAAGLNPGIVNTFDYDANNMPDLCYIDEGEMKIKFIIRNMDGVPETIFKYNINFPHKEILVYKNSAQTNFCLWTRGKNLIEIINADFSNNQFKNYILYSSGKIQDLKIKPEGENPASIYAAFINDGKAGANVFEYHDFRYIKSDYSGFAPDAADVTAYISAGQQGFYTWSGTDKLNLYFYDIKDLKSPHFIAQTNSGNEVFSFSGSLADNTPGYVTLIKKGAISSLGLSAKKFSEIRLPEEINIRDFHQLYVSPSPPGSLTRIYAYLPDKKSLNLITLYNRGKNLILSEKISGINVNRYIVQNMDLVDTHIIYSDPEENCITIKRIK